VSGELYFAPGRLLAKLNDTLEDFCERSTPVLDLSAANLPLQAIVSCKCQRSVVIRFTDKEACRPNIEENGSGFLYLFHGRACYLSVHTALTVSLLSNVITTGAWKCHQGATTSPCASEGVCA